ncbi:MAG: T9SS type A sorting domain-containing protein [Candidatus Stahlbacteria bacterium]|nr:T9SS type A sorting domain-containing protein [Candidatus Stahlbacteria bacterium]
MFLIRIIVLITLFSCSGVFAQIKWEKYPNNPVIIKSNNIWEFRAIGQPECLLENDTFKMWYVGGGGLFTNVAVINYAYSTDGINWTKHPTPILYQGTAGEWDSKWMDTPAIVRDSVGYKLYYFGDITNSFPPLLPAFGLATSTDGINFEKYSGNPVFLKGDTTEWDGFWIESPMIIFDEGIYKMWYTGMSRNWQGQVGYATSTDGINWQKYSGNPVLKTGVAGSGEDFVAGVCTIVKRDTLYEMWYGGVSLQDMVNDTIDTVNVGYAFSNDGIHWEKYTNNPVISTYSPNYDPDSGSPWAPTVVFTGTEYKMWYESRCAGFGLASSQLEGIEEKSLLPGGDVATLQISPNPFYKSILIQYEVIGLTHVVLKLYDVAGKMIKTLVDKKGSPGHYTLSCGEELPSGIYFLHMEAGKVKIIQKLIKVR